MSEKNYYTLNNIICELYEEKNFSLDNKPDYANFEIQKNKEFNDIFYTVGLSEEKELLKKKIHSALMSMGKTL